MPRRKGSKNKKTMEAVNLTVEQLDEKIAAIEAEIAEISASLKAKKAELKDFNPYDGFDPAKGHITDQIDEITNLALKYHFCQPEHFDLVMEHFGVKVIRNEAHGFEWITLQGLDQINKADLINPVGMYYLIL